MKIIPIKTEKIIPEKHDDILSVIDKFVVSFPEKSVLAVTSKIVSICEGRYVKADEEKKDEIIISEADWYVPRSENRYNMLLTITGGALNFSSGVDESNTNGYFVLWPNDSQETANKIREHLCRKHGVTYAGVVITDTASVPTRWGQRGVFVLAHSGFSALNRYIGKEDIFGRKMNFTSSSISDALGGAATLVMGEGNEQTPIALIEDVPFVDFIERDPTEEELIGLKMNMEDDLYADMLLSLNWRKGGGFHLTKKKKGL